MALQRQGPSVGVQLQSSFPIANYALDNTLAQEAQAWGTIGSIAQTGFDMVKRDYDKDQIEQAQLDAPQLIQKDGKGLTLPVSTFEPPGITSRAYRDAYKTFGKNAYTVSVEQDHSNFLNEVQAKYPADIATARAAMDERRNQVVAGLDPELAPLISLKLNAMNGQISSRINANVQAQTNKVAEEKGLYAYQDVIKQISRLATTPNKFEIETITAANGQVKLDVEKADGLLAAAGYPEAKRKHMWERAWVETRIVRDERHTRDFFADKDQWTPGEYEEKLLKIRKEALIVSEQMGPDGDAYWKRITAAIGYASQTAQLQVQKQDAVMFADQQNKNNDLRQKLETGSGLGITPADVMREAEAERFKTYNSPFLSAAQKVRGLGMLDQTMGRARADIGEYANRSVLSLANEATSTDPSMTQERRNAVREELKQFGSDPIIAGYVPVATKNYAQRIVSQLATDEAKTNVAQTISDSQGGYTAPEDIRSWGKRNAHLIGDGALINPKQWRDLLINNDLAFGARQNSMSVAERVADNARRGVRSTSTDLATVKDLPGFSFRGNYDPVNPESRANADAFLRSTMSFPEAQKTAFKNMQFNGDPAYTAALIEQYKGNKTVLMNKPRFDEERAIGLMRDELGKDSVDYIALAIRFGPEAAAKTMLSRKNSASQNRGASSGETVETMHQEVAKTFQSMAEMHQPQVDTTIDGRTRHNEWSDRMLTIGNYGRFKEISVLPDLQQEIVAGAYSFLQEDGEVMNVSHANSSAKQIAIKQFAEKYRDRMELVADPNNPERGVWQWKSATTKLSEAFKGASITDNMRKGIALGLFDTQEAYLNSINASPRAFDNFDRSSVDIIQSRSSDGSLSWKVMANLPNSMGVTTLMTLAENDPRLGAFAGDVMTQAQKDLEKHWYGKTAKPDDRTSGWFASTVVGELFAGASKALEPLDRAVNKVLAPEWALARVADSKKKEMVEQRLDQQSFFERTFNPAIRNPPSLHGTMDFAKTRKAMEDSRDADMQRRFKDYEYLRTLDARIKANR